eukprot:CAMPEP_0194085918 /NCGR_PEP_ID=MMETSP0149-20130528/19256_1 /TAXON_ID=122233 /ORGANISM="Chaetoceros debilis, Strain MM31A-1" /LENGTH=63 /DNA_ID=CAMNT_0038768905 /DNA_START=385 /DNA_END=573 /DNA_ORIENTATION=-
MARKTASEQKKKKKLKTSSKKPSSVPKNISTTDLGASNEDCAGSGIHLNEPGDCQCFLRRGAL